MAEKLRYHSLLPYDVGPEEARLPRIKAGLLQALAEHHAKRFFFFDTQLENHMDLKYRLAGQVRSGDRSFSPLSSFCSRPLGRTSSTWCRSS